ncbi:hypothetical protein BJ165DRAFT_1594661 [Panaeolus papilionaceus]|nr:hypothetical protein BJ165DRAFT_1594661 [Panaeolus papilionaceus]
MSSLFNFFGRKGVRPSSIPPILDASPLEKLVAFGAAQIDIKDISLTSEFVILVFGEAGSGKSTIINLIAGKEILQINNQLEVRDEFKVVRVRDPRGSVCLIEVPQSPKTRFYSLYQRYNVIGVIFVHKVNDGGVVKGLLQLDLDQVKKVCKNDVFLASQLICVTTHWATPQYDKSEDLATEKLLTTSEKCWGNSDAGGGQIEFRRFALEKPEEVKTILSDLSEREKASAEILWRECSDGEVSASNAYQIIVVMGDTGTGKSNFIAKAINNPMYNSEGESLDSVTGKVQALKVHIGSHRFILVDTPGFNDSNRTRSDYEILKMIAKWLEETFKHKILLDGVLYFHRITDNRMPGSAVQNLVTFRALVGKGLVSRNIKFVTSMHMWDLDVEGKGQVREDKLASDFWAAMLNEGAVIKQFRNSHESAREVLEGFRLEWNQKYALQLQTELVNEGQNLNATEAGRSVYGKLHDALKDLQQSVQAMEDARSRGLSLPEDQRRKMLEDVEKVQRDMDKLRVGVRGESSKLLRRLFWYLF